MDQIGLKIGDGLHQAIGQKSVPEARTEPSRGVKDPVDSLIDADPRQGRGTCPSILGQIQGLPGTTAPTKDRRLVAHLALKLSRCAGIVLCTADVIGVVLVDDMENEMDFELVLDGTKQARKAKKMEERMKRQKEKDLMKEMDEKEISFIKSRNQFKKLQDDINDAMLLDKTKVALKKTASMVDLARKIGHSILEYYYSEKLGLLEMQGE